MESKGHETKIGEHVNMNSSTLDFVESFNYSSDKPISNLFDLASSYIKKKLRNMNDGGWQGGFFDTAWFDGGQHGELSLAFLSSREKEPGANPI